MTDFLGFAIVYNANLYTQTEFALKTSISGTTVVTYMLMNAELKPSYKSFFSHVYIQIIITRLPLSG
jgi:hypothetical protein